MLRLAADENFNGRIVRSLLRKIDQLDLVRVQDTPLYGADDPTVLAWAADEGRILLTHDFATLIGHAYERVSLGHPMPGIFIARSDSTLGPVVADLELLIQASRPDEHEGQILYLPW